MTDGLLGCRHRRLISLLAARISIVYGREYFDLSLWASMLPVAYSLTD